MIQRKCRVETRSGKVGLWPLLPMWGSVSVPVKYRLAIYNIGNVLGNRAKYKQFFTPCKVTHLLAKVQAHPQCYVNK